MVDTKTKVDELLSKKLRMNDIGNSERFYEANRNRLVYITEIKQWHEWDDGKWKPVSRNKVLNEAEKVSKNIYREASKLSQNSEAKALSNWAASSHANYRLKSMLELAEGKLSRSLMDFDSENYKLNCKNGVLKFDKEKGETLNKHSPNALMLKQANAEYNPLVRSEEWEKFISDVFCKDEGIISYVKRALGYCLLGSVEEHCAFFAYGLGANGKSTLFETVQDVLGDYGRTTEVEIILSDSKKGVRDKEAIGRLAGVRYAVASEIGSDRFLNSPQFKQIIGGDTLTGAKMYGDTFEFKPTFKLWFLCNHLPRFKEGTAGLTRRIRVIPFNKSFKDSRDKGIKARLWKERDGILTWLVEGAIEYLAFGLPDTHHEDIPEAIKNATNAYILENDVLGRYMDECLDVVDMKTKVANASLHPDYEEWCSAQRIMPLSIQHFARFMKERIPNWKEEQRALVYYGYALKKGAQPIPAEKMPYVEQAVTTQSYGSWQDVPKQTDEDGPPRDTREEWAGY